MADSISRFSRTVENYRGIARLIPKLLLSFCKKPVNLPTPRPLLISARAQDSYRRYFSGPEYTAMLEELETVFQNYQVHGNVTIEYECRMCYGQFH